MKTLAMHNLEVQHQPHQLGRTGLACDRCGHELLFSDDRIKMSLPAKRSVHCPKCNFEGLMLIPSKEEY